MNEFGLIKRYFTRPTPQAILGPGDDCALFAPTPGMELAVTTDMLVAGTHFFPDTEPNQLGWKTLAVNLSDLAAMGAKPRWALLAGALPDADELWLGHFSAGIFACAQHYGVDLIGGDTTRGPLNLCVTAFGEIPAGRALRRDAACAGDDVWVSGEPGLAALGLAQLQGKVSLHGALADACRTALQKPVPRIELGLALREQGLARSAIDISDGLMADLGHILERSQLAAELELSLLPSLPAGVDPRLARDCQLAGGDDYELVFTAASDKRQAIAELAAALGLPIWRCGRVSIGTAGALTLRDAQGHVLPIDDNSPRGFDHFG